MTRWLTDDEQRAWRGLVRMTAGLTARLNRELQRSAGLSLADYEVLVLLTEAPDGRLRMFQLADELHWEQSRLSHHLARMHGRGLVAREDCPTDRRGAYVTLTVTGRTAIETAAPAHAAQVRALAFTDVPPSELAALEAFTTRTQSHLNPHHP